MPDNADIFFFILLSILSVGVGVVIVGGILAILSTFNWPFAFSPTKKYLEKHKEQNFVKLKRKDFFNYYAINKDRFPSVSKMHFNKKGVAKFPGYEPFFVFAWLGKINPYITMDRVICFHEYDKYCVIYFSFIDSIIVSYYFHKKFSRNYKLARQKKMNKSQIEFLNSIQSDIDHIKEEADKQISQAHKEMKDINKRMKLTLGKEIDTDADD